MITLKEARELVGKEYEFYREGKAWACVAPMYEILPETLAYRYDIEDTEDILSHFEKNAQKIDLTSIQFGDIIVVLLPWGLWHLLVYLEKDDCMHATKDTGMAITSISKYASRIRGVFRYGGNSCVEMA